MWRNFTVLLIILTTILNGCADGDTSKKETDYESTKKIVVDILQTEDGRKAIQEAIHDEDMKKELVIQSDIVKSSINETFNSEDGTKMWTRLFEDPTFVEQFVKSTEEGQKKLMKSLMYDATFQKKMLELFQNPEMMKQTLTVVKGQQFREYLEETIQESLSSPLFLAKIERTLLKAVEEEKEKEEKEEKEKKEEKSDESKDDSESESESESEGDDEENSEGM